MRIFTSDAIQDGRNRHLESSLKPYFLIALRRIQIWKGYFSHSNMLKCAFFKIQMVIYRKWCKREP